MIDTERCPNCGILSLPLTVQRTCEMGEQGIACFVCADDETCCQCCTWRREQRLLMEWEA